MSGLIPVLTLAAMPLSEPLQQSSLLAAEDWVQGALLGSIGTAAAVIAVAAMGFLLLAGRLSVRRGLTVIAGCFVLFGSSTIAQGIMSGLGIGSGATQSQMAPVSVEAPSPLAAVPTPAPSHVPYDPYAGAAVPMHH
ncbi:hypothetical protein CA234_03530 [Sphingomonas sp. ABOLE]|uniref:TrbC/VirB2 family protein n=1 Tax=Sphingomonas sp. ABOLE TaxID=1985878 RepID=UPI000F7E19FC|nr:TrbC/VirB2 family protein [Sphingomonas sp. ABOLE]RSV43818.1 hypothetical protein CA234_03530 [Sphingomonas sp. ABOLE]